MVIRGGIGVVTPSLEFEGELPPSPWNRWGILSPQNSKWLSLVKVPPHYFFFGGGGIIQ